MAQGIALDKKEVIRTLEPILKLGCSLRKACEYAGVPYTTVHTWVKNSEELRIKINSWRNEPNLQARKNWIKKLQEEDYNASVTWLSKKEKDEFSDRMENTGKDGERLVIPILSNVHSDDSTPEASQTEEED